MEQKPKKILLGLTTTPASDWRGKVEEMKRFGIKEIALFPTFLKKSERDELYALLEGIDGLRIPHIHLRDDMGEDELIYLETTYHPVAYNIHDHPRLVPVYEKYRHKIFVENHFHPFPDGIVGEYAGICLDTQHHYRNLFRSPGAFLKLLRHLRSGVSTIGCCHLSPMKSLRNRSKRKRLGVGSHYMIDLREYEYVKQYVKYLPEYVSIEAENTFAEQLRIREYLDGIINA
ncbi:MAG: hypothetical protein WCJ25_00130 [Candidatus Moraniibacteriota bacterium]